MRRTVLRAAAAGAATIAAVLAGCDRAPRTESSATPGRAGAPPRVVALGPAIARTLAEAGHADLLVGRHAFDLWTDPALPVCGDQSGIDYEALLSVHPTHVLLQWGRRDLPPRLEALARRHGWIVRNFPLLSLDEVLGSIDQAWTMLGPPRDDPPGVRLRAVLDDRAGIDPARVGRVLLLAGTRPPTALGPGSYHHDMLVRLGTTPAIIRGAPYIALDAEDVLRLSPDAIILVQPRWPGAAGTAPDSDGAVTRLGRLARLNLPAIRSGRVALIDDPMAFIPGSNLVETARSLRQALRGWSDAAGHPP